jgi:hypothetical protein
MKIFLIARPLALAAALAFTAGLAAPAPALAQAQTQAQTQAQAQARPLAAAPLRGQLRLPEFAKLTEKASEVVSVTLDSRLLNMACRFLNAEDPEQAEARKLCSSLRGIFVRHFTFETDFAYPKADVDAVRRQLNGPGWSQIVGAISKKDKTDVDVFVLIEGDKAQGLSIIASQPREFTIVNIVGSIDLEQLHDLQGKFGVPELDIEKPAPKKK